MCHWDLDASNAARVVSLVSLKSGRRQGRVPLQRLIGSEARAFIGKHLASDQQQIACCLWKLMPH